MSDDNIKEGTKVAPRLIKGKDVVRKGGTFLNSAFDEYYFKKVVGEDIEMLSGGQILECSSLEELKQKWRRNICGVCCSNLDVNGFGLFYFEDEEQRWEECKELDSIKKDMKNPQKIKGFLNTGKAECYIKGTCRVIVSNGKRYIVFNADYRNSDHIQVAKQLVLENYLFEEDFYIVNQKTRQQYLIRLKRYDKWHDERRNKKSVEELPLAIKNKISEITKKWSGMIMKGESEENIDKYFKSENAVRIYNTAYCARIK